MRSEDVGTRRRAVRAIAEMPEAPGAIAALADALADPDPSVSGCAALVLGRHDVAAAAPTLVRMVVQGSNDVEAAEVLGRLSRDPEHAACIATAVSEELASPAAGSATRIRLTQALVELEETIAREMLRHLSHDEDRVVALLASSLLSAEQERPGEQC
ncbi:HEAT repeat domain-containing protein [Streptomyces spiramenti]|uniref:HEAT repeat domain-containing protein n=1 Tax=Streptomyces spiramenti TaxID=2720606 RepID=UPI003084239B